MKNKELTLEQIEYIKSNYLEFSIVDMADHIKSNFYQVRKVMYEHNLVVDQKTIQKFKSKNKIRKSKSSNNNYDESYQKPDWVFDFWNHSLNPITMYFVNNVK